MTPKVPSGCSQQIIILLFIYCFIFFQIAYEADAVQMKFLRLLSRQATQTIKHDCVKDDLQLLGTNNRELPHHTSGCKVCWVSLKYVFKYF